MNRLLLLLFQKSALEISCLPLAARSTEAWAAIWENGLCLSPQTKLFLMDKKLLFGQSRLKYATHACRNVKDDSRGGYRCPHCLTFVEKCKMGGNRRQFKSTINFTLALNIPVSTYRVRFCGCIPHQMAFLRVSGEI